MLMDKTLTVRYGKQVLARRLTVTGNRWMTIGAVLLATAVHAMAQGAGVKEAVQQAVAANKQKLLQYQWIETTQVTLNGDPKPPTQNICRYGPDGQVQKTPVGPPPPPPSGGRMKQRVIEKKKAEIQDYMADVKGVLGLYVPPDPQKMQQAIQSGKVTLNPAGGMVNIVFPDYAQPGDRMTITFDSAAKKVVSLDINTYMGQAKDVVTLQVQMGSLPDGTNYTQQTILNATAKKIVATTTSGSYQRIGN
jgi:hypothetical protein